MKKILITVIFATALVFSGESISEGDVEEIYEGEITTVVSKNTRKKPEPTILQNNREISITIADAKSMKITAFSLNGRKLFRKEFSGETALFKAPRSAKNTIIVQIDSHGRFYSRKVVLN